MRSIAESTARACIGRPAGARRILIMVLAGAALAGGWGPPARPQGRALPPASLQARFCAADGPVAPAGAMLDDLLERRADLRAARARTEAAAHMVEVARAAEAQRLEVGAMLGVTSHGLNNMVHTGSDVGQAALGVWSPPAERRAGTPLQLARAELQAAAVAYAWALTQAHREVAAAAAEVQAVEGRLARHAASVADAEAAQKTLRQAQAEEADLLRSQNEVQLRRERLTAERARGQAARAALATAIGCADR